MVVVTDYPDDTILGNLERNVERARAHAAEPSVVHCVGYEWGTDVSPLL
jgi:EEF1A N-terminal glycine/lysine methyltransferase